MPLFRADGKLYFYAHVPKCAGSAVERYLESRFGRLGFHIGRYLERHEAERWSRTSPQHTTFDDFAQFIPCEWISGSFAVVRHPVDRVVSAYHFQKDTERSFDPSTSIEDWFGDWVEARERSPFMYDNHLRPQSDFVPDTAAVFHLEHGLDHVIPWLDQIAGNTDGPREMVMVNTAKSKKPKARPTDELLEMIEDVYAADFARFDYVIGEKMPRNERSDSVAAVQPLPPRRKPASKARRVARKIKKKIGLH